MNLRSIPIKIYEFPPMWSRTVSLLLVATLAIASQSARAGELLSIRGIALPENGYVAAFHIQTWGVTVVSVCRFPPGWTITAGRSADPTGVLNGEASLGVTFINKERLRDLDRLFLIEVEDYHAHAVSSGDNAGGFLPATFVGNVSVGTYGDEDLNWHDVPLTAANLVREPAARCP
jgi:hypothetical protein